MTTSAPATPIFATSPPSSLSPSAATATRFLRWRFTFFPEVLTWRKLKAPCFETWRLVWMERACGVWGFWGFFFFLMVFGVRVRIGDFVIFC